MAPKKIYIIKYALKTEWVINTRADQKTGTSYENYLGLAYFKKREDSLYRESFLALDDFSICGDANVLLLERILEIYGK